MAGKGQEQPPDGAASGQDYTLLSPKPLSPCRPHFSTIQGWWSFQASPRRTERRSEWPFVWDALPARSRHHRRTAPPTADVLVFPPSLTTHRWLSAAWSALISETKARPGPAHRLPSPHPSHTEGRRPQASPLSPQVSLPPVPSARRLSPGSLRKLPLAGKSGKGRGGPPPWHSFERARPEREG